MGNPDANANVLNTVKNTVYVKPKTKNSGAHFHLFFPFPHVLFFVQSQIKSKEEPRLSVLAL